MNRNGVRNGLGLGAFALPLVFASYGCNQQTVEAKLRSLQASNQVTFVCRGVESGVPRDRCPDVDNDPAQTLLDALVTQTATDEIAIVDVKNAIVVDNDLTIPGYNFLRLPSRPGDIVTTPGGIASFVGLTSAGKTGISAIPTDCLGPPKVASIAQGIPQSQRDVTTFPACRLPSAPGEMALLVEPPAADGTISETCSDRTTPESKEPPGGTRYSVVDAASAEECTATAGPGEYPHYGKWVALEGGGFECRMPNGRDCAANLTTEEGPSGRRKLVVALPDEGRLVVLDAQAILDREPGSFEPCAIDREIVLSSAPDSSGQKQQLPPDLDGFERCMLEPPTSPPGTAARSRPSGFGASDERLFVGDLGVPLVHVLDTTSVCGAHELPPLLPMSLVAPWRAVTTSRVAVTPVTPAGKQYVYAVDSNDQPSSSVLMFDVSDGVTDRTPIVRPGSPKQPRESADRLQFPAPIADLTFALRDLADSDPATGVAELGTECDPDPSLPLNPPPAEVQYRSSADHTQGARPKLLRGLFGLVLLTNGQVYVVDVDDFDHKCRRPIGANASSTPDFRGCANDPADIAFYTYTLDDSGQPVPDGEGGTKTVTGEASCNMVQPHRTRSALLGLADATLGIGAPALRALPRFEPARSATQVKVDERPKLLAVPFASPEGGAGVPPEVYVGTTLYTQGNSSTELPTAPTSDQDQNGLTLPPSEPRSYLAGDHNVLVYEGRVVGGDYQSGFFDLSGLGLEPGMNGVLSDPAAFYCGNSVYDVDAMASYAREMLGLSDQAARDFAEGDDEDKAKGHADYVQITGDFPSLTDPYWQSLRGVAGGGREECLEIFGPPPGQAEDLESNRDFRILEAYQDHLVIRPRSLPLVTADPSRFDEGSVERAQEEQLLAEQQAAHDAFPDKIKVAVAYCFPAGVKYTVRGANQWVLTNGTPWLHDTVVDHRNLDRCIRDCNPQKRWFKNRAFELATTDTCGPEKTADACRATGVGPGTADDGPCRYDPYVSDANEKFTRGISLNEPNGAPNCIFENLTSRFAVYRGKLPSVRDMAFVWDQTGGFYPLTGSLTAQSSVVLPQHIAYVPEYESIMVVDGASLGLSLMTLDTLLIQDPWPVF
ncbi:MAG TPA: hypothetical protein VNN72_04260 [Polyangiaceae bacterium]|nr:hypothetical protein [Polyangiaceae bacterium]